jgi:hypothetical protein
MAGVSTHGASSSGLEPFDTPTLLRFALLVLIPISSWVAGALVERLVDLALG